MYSNYGALKFLHIFMLFIDIVIMIFRFYFFIKFLCRGLLICNEYTNIECH